MYNMICVAHSSNQSVLGTKWSKLIGHKPVYLILHSKYIQYPVVVFSMLTFAVDAYKYLIVFVLF